MMSHLAKVVIPLDIETYLQYHFTKVGDQTRMFLDNYAALAETQERSAANIESLRAALRIRDEQQAVR